MQQRAEKLHIFISVVVIAYVIVIQRALAQMTVFNFTTDQILAILTSVGIYRILVTSVFFIGNRSPAVLGILWGRDYINGL